MLFSNMEKPSTLLIERPYSRKRRRLRAMSRTRPGRVFFLRTAQCTNMAPLRGSSDGDDSLVSSTTSADSEPTLQVGLRASYCSSYLTAIWRTVCGTDLALIKTRYGRSLAISTATRSDSTKITRSTQGPRNTGMCKCDPSLATSVSPVVTLSSRWDYDGCRWC